MADPTREQAIEACRKNARGLRAFGEDFGHGSEAASLDHAATLLNRDGRLRERLEGLVAELRERCTTETEMKLHGWESLIDVLKDCADDLEAALKEGV